MIVIESAIMEMRCAELMYYYFALESYCKLSLVRRLYCYWSSSVFFILFVPLFSFLFLQNGKSRLTFYAISQMYLLLIFVKSRFKLSSYRQCNNFAYEVHN